MRQATPGEVERAGMGETRLCRLKRKGQQARRPGEQEREVLAPYRMMGVPVAAANWNVEYTYGRYA